MHALILFIVLAADPTPAPSPCPPPLTPREIAWKKLCDANTEWFRLQAIADAKAQDIATKKQTLADKVKELQGEIDGAVTLSTSAAGEADKARHVLSDAGNAYADIVDPEGATKKPSPAKVETPKPVVEKPKVPIVTELAPAIQDRPRVTIYYGESCVPCHALMDDIKRLKGSDNYDVSYVQASGEVPVTDVQYRGHEYRLQGYGGYEHWHAWIFEKINESLK